MQRVYQPKTLGFAGLLAVVAMTAIATFGAVAAQAEGPVWIVLLANNELVVLSGGAKEAFTSSGSSFVLDGTTASIECATEKDTGEIIGTNPGTDLTTIHFEKCNVVGHVNCLAGNVTEEEIEVAGLQTILAYPTTSEAPNNKEALDAFFPASGKVFTKFKLKTTPGQTEHTCGEALNGVEVEVLADGTELASPPLQSAKANCGVLAWVGKLNALAEFVLTISGEEALTGALKSEGVPIEALLEKGSTFEKITCELLAFGAKATELGISDVTLNSGLEFGWEI